MEAGYGYMHIASQWVQGHISAISTALTTTLLVVFGDDINRFVKKRIRHHNFLLRTIVFVALCVFGYGMLSVFIAPTVTTVLRTFGDRYLAATVAGAFLLTGILADRKKYM